MSVPDEKLTLPQVKESLEAVLGHFGPQELTDGVHDHLTFLLGLVNECLDEDAG